MTTFVVFVCQLAKHSWHPHGAHSSPEMRYSTIAVIRWPCATDFVGKKIFAWFSDALKLSVSQESVGRITVAILVITIFKKHHPRPEHIKCNLVSQIVTTVFLFCWMPQNSNVEKKKHICNSVSWRLSQSNASTVSQSDEIILHILNTELRIDDSSLGDLTLISCLAERQTSKLVVVHHI